MVCQCDTGGISLSKTTVLRKTGPEQRLWLVFQDVRWHTKCFRVLLRHQRLRTRSNRVIEVSCKIFKSLSLIRLNELLYRRTTTVGWDSKVFVTRRRAFSSRVRELGWKGPPGSPLHLGPFTDYSLSPSTPGTVETTNI